MALGGAQTDKMSGDNQDGGGPVPSGSSSAIVDKDGTSKEEGEMDEGEDGHINKLKNARKGGGDGREGAVLKTAKKGGAGARSRVGMIDP